MKPNYQKLYVVLLLTTCFWQFTSAQDVKRFEAEARLGATFPVGFLGHTERVSGPSMGLELRYNFRKIPLDIGLAAELTTAVYKLNRNGRSDYQSNRTATITLFSDYNFKQGRKVNPFIGTGIGLGMNNALNDLLYEVNEGGTCVFVPRIGVELFRHLRLSLSSHISQKGYNNICFSIGYAFGGGLKKTYGCYCEY